MNQIRSFITSTNKQVTSVMYVCSNLTAYTFDHSWSQGIEKCFNNYAYEITHYISYMSNTFHYPNTERFDPKSVYLHNKLIRR